MKTIFSSLFILLLLGANAQSNNEPPKLVVGIVVDQMRQNYIEKYWNKYGSGGFKRLVNEGYNCRNTHYNYIPTYTGPGHASIYTGTTPATHGIIANSWYDKRSGEKIYCVDDTLTQLVGTKGISKSPRRLLTTTIGDELRLSNNRRSKVISISLKDRGSVLPGGHLANAAYWLDSKSGMWVSSTQYLNELPEWLEKFNKEERTKKYLSKPWKTILDISLYQESEADNNHYEGPFETETDPVFPHDLPTIFAETQDYGLIKSTPFGNTLTKELAMRAIGAESLGTDGYPDLLAISFSATDYVGHQFGPQSLELEDTYIRLDQDLSALLKELDQRVGPENYVLFLTADHGAVRVPQYLMDNDIPAGYFETETIVDQANRFLSNYMGEGAWVQNFSNNQFFLNMDLVYEQKKGKKEVEDLLVEYALTLEGVANAYTSSDLIATNNGGKFLSLVQKGYNQKNSGNVAITLLPGWVTFPRKGTTHGSAYSYDTHVPLLWYGNGIPKGSTSKEMYITDVAATVATILNISFPNGSIGKPILEVVE